MTQTTAKRCPAPPLLGLVLISGCSREIKGGVLADDVWIERRNDRPVFKTQLQDQEAIAESVGDRFLRVQGGYLWDPAALSNNAPADPGLTKRDALEMLDFGLALVEPTLPTLPPRQTP